MAQNEIKNLQVIHGEGNKINRSSKFRYLVSGFILGSVLFSGLTYAATTNSISVSLDRVKFIINGVDKTTSDGKFNNQGSIVPASFIYSGTTYIPMRMVSNMLGKTVDWDGSTRSVIIGSEKGEGVSLTNTIPIKSYSSVQMNPSMQVNQQKYNHGISLSATTGGQKNAFATFVTDRQYKTFTGQIGLDDKLNASSNPTGYDVQIYAYYPNELDTEKILWKGSVVPGAPLQEFNVDIQGTYSIGIQVFTRVESLWLDSDSRGTIVVVDPYLVK
jgi:hypothetical protein